MHPLAAGLVVVLFAAPAALLLVSAWVAFAESPKRSAPSPVVVDARDRPRTRRADTPNKDLRK